MRNKTILIITLFLIILHLSGCSQKAGCDSYEELAEVYFQAVQDNDLDAIMGLEEPGYIDELNEDGMDWTQFYNINDSYYSAFQHTLIESKEILSTQIISPAEEATTFENELADAESYIVYEITFSSGETSFVVLMCYSTDNRWYYYGSLAFKDFDMLPAALKKNIHSDILH